MKKQLNQNTHMLLIGACVLTLLIVLSLVLVYKAGGWKQFVTPVNYPTEGWQTSTSEEQGFDSAKLADGLDAIRKNGTLIHSLLIERHGALILNATFYPYNPSAYHDVASVTKSVMTTLIGIAIDQRKLDLDQPVVTFFPNRTIANRDARKEQLTVRHLVSMSSGLDCTAQDGEKTLEEMKDSPDWIQFVLDRKMIYEPGTHFEYCSPGMHLLSAILQQATGMSALQYAKLNLFEPIGIHEVDWPVDPQGYNHGWGDLALYPQDMAKLGYLFLHGGRWGGKQIVSRAWINQATQRQIGTDSPDEDYGYGWWVSRPDAEISYYLASGRGGQQILVAPSLDLVLVTTGGGFEFGEIEKYIQAALGDVKKPLPADPAGVEQLNALVRDLALAPTAHPAPSLPETAATISGKLFALEQPNPLEMKSLQLDFGDSAEATLQVNKLKPAESRIVQIGLDGVYRSSQGLSPMIARGGWADKQSFVMDYDEGLGLDTYILTMKFDANHVVIEFKDFSHGNQIFHLQGKRVSNAELNIKQKRIARE